jgi:hypothetical protein
MDYLSEFLVLSLLSIKFCCLSKEDKRIETVRPIYDSSTDLPSCEAVKEGRRG